MKTIIRNYPHNLEKLHDELLAAIPALRPTEPDPRGRLLAAMLLTDQGDQITLQVPDRVTEADIDAVLAVHDPTPLPPAPNSREARVAAVRAGGGTQAQRLAALEALVLNLAGEDR